MAELAEQVNTEEHDPQYEPVMRLTEQIETKTHEEDEDVIFKMRAKLFRFEVATTEWKERGTGDVRLLQHKTTKRVRLVMRRDKTLKLCANHAISADMKLQPNVGSDRSWVWKVVADYAEETPSAETLAIRFANSDNANLFKTKFEEAQTINAGLSSSAPAEGTTEETNVDEMARGETAAEEAEPKPESSPKQETAEVSDEAKAEEAGQVEAEEKKAEETEEKKEGDEDSE